MRLIISKHQAWRTRRRRASWSLLHKVMEKGVCLLFKGQASQMPLLAFPWQVGPWWDQMLPLVTDIYVSRF